MTNSPPRQAGGDELVEVIDEGGRVIRQAPRREVRADNLLHRSVFVAVVNSADELIVHQRADWKDVWASRWDVCFGGVVDVGEPWDDAAVRELAEEAGIVVARAAFEDLGEGRYEDELVREVSRVYVVRSDGPFSFDDGEVVAVDRVGLANVSAWAAAHDLCDDSRALVLPRLLAHSGYPVASRGGP